MKGRTPLILLGISAALGLVWWFFGRRRGTILVGGKIVPVSVQTRTGTPYPTARSRTKTFAGVIVHDTVTSTVGGMESTLRAKGLGTHFAIEPDGAVVQYHDPIADEVDHAATANSRYAGIDVVNPFDGPAKPPWTTRVEYPYRGGVDTRVAPTTAQERSLEVLVRAILRAEGITPSLMTTGALLDTAQWRGVLSVVAHGQIQPNRRDGVYEVQRLGARHPTWIVSVLSEVA